MLSKIIYPRQIYQTMTIGGRGQEKQSQPLNGIADDNAQQLIQVYIEAYIKIARENSLRNPSYFIFPFPTTVIDLHGFSDES